MARPLEVPEVISALGLLDRVDYQDAFAASSEFPGMTHCG